MKNYYQVLGIPRDASAGQIKRAYRKLIKACHPDVNASPQSIEWTRELNEAYATLADPKARTSYDLDLGLGPDWGRPAPPESSARSAPSARTEGPAAGPRPPESGPRVQADAAPAPEINFYCDHCNRTD